VDHAIHLGQWRIQGGSLDQQPPKTGVASLW